MAEKSLNEMPRELRPLYTKGSDALLRDNFDYATELFSQILQREPGLYECRKALRTAQQRKAGSGGGMFKKMWSSASASPMVAKGQMTLRKDPAEALVIAEQILNGDPANSGAHRLVVEAARALEMPQTAAMSLEVLNRNSPKDKDVAMQYASALAEIGQVARGEKILSDLYRQTPTDNDLAQALKDLSARKTLKEGGYQALASGTGSYRDILKDKDEAVILEQENRQVKTEDTAERLITEYESRLKAEPKNIKVMRDLAELYTQKKQFDRALSYYDQIKSSEIGADASLDRAMGETRMRKYDHQLSQLDVNAPDYAEKTAVLQAEKQAYQLAECQKRAERFPTDLQLRFELGQVYFQMGKIGEAILEFQKAQNNPHRRIASMNFLAQCYAKRRMFDLAARALQTAIKEKPAFDDEKKELTYNLGSVLESMGKREEAFEQFKLIYELDAGYKDVSAKIDHYYGGQG
jgi:tetratricopeptide (TPR) repeat protein